MLLGTAHQLFNENFKLILTNPENDRGYGPRLDEGPFLCGIAAITPRVLADNTPLHTYSHVDRFSLLYDQELQRRFPIFALRPRMRHILSCRSDHYGLGMWPVRLASIARISLLISVPGASLISHHPRRDFTAIRQTASPSMRTTKIPSNASAPSRTPRSTAVLSMPNLSNQLTAKRLPPVLS
jgi:hypothetical protein